MDLSRLNAGQRAAVVAPDGAVLVVAGAGTGKTQTLVHRVAWLVEQGVPPDQIVLLTFTRRAANEMLDRAARMVGDQARRVRGGTFHAFAAINLRIHGHRLGYTPRFTILDADDAERFVAHARADLGLAGKERGFLRADALASMWSLHRNTGRLFGEIVEEVRPEHVGDVPDMIRVLQEADRRRKASDAMDYDDLLVRFAELLWDHDEVRTRISRGCRHVLVDEYQDTNRVQAKIAAALCVAHGNILAVGDEAQSIYAFRGATVRNILDFPQMFDACQIVKLEESYRSTNAVLRLANGVLSSAAEGFEKNLRSALGDGDLPELLDVDDEDEQAEEVAERIVAFRDGGGALAEVAVLVRSGFHSNLLEVALGRRGVRFRKFGGIRFVDAAHVKDALAAFRVLANPRDHLAWMRVLSTLEGVGDGTAAKLAEEAARDGIDTAKYQKRKWGPALNHLVSSLAAARDAAPEERARLVLRWYRPAMERLYDDIDKRGKDLDSLEHVAGRAGDLDAFLADMSLDPPQEAPDKADDAEDVLTISTIHSAKGLEWRAVFVLSVVDGGFPSAYALGDPEDVEEERRLLYVAVTRAKERLVLVRPRYLRARGGGAYVEPGVNTLLDDIPRVEALVRPGRRVLRPSGGGITAKTRMDRMRAWFDD